MPTFQYPSPLDLPDHIQLNERVITINGMPFQKRSDCNYQSDYYAHIDSINRYNSFSPEKKKKFALYHEANQHRNLLQDDLWSFVYFVMKNPLANHPFIVEACKEIQAETEDTLELWARDHLKTTIITVGRNIQEVLNDPELKIGIFSATRGLAVAILRMIQTVLESPFLLACFPDILYENPEKESVWSLGVDGGLFLKRKGFYKEATFSAWGLTEGMPTGYHFDKRVYDDIVTQNTLAPEVMQKVKDNFDMSQYTATRKGRSTVVGTLYRHDDPLKYIEDMVDPITGQKLYKTRRKTGSIDGTINGEPVFLPPKKFAFMRATNLHMFKCQQLLDPSPEGSQKLNPDLLIKVTKNDLPVNLYKFMLVDGAGNKGTRTDGKVPDAWALGIIGVQPFRDDHGLSKIYILDLLIEPMPMERALKEIIAMYSRNGRILKLGIEKVGQSSTEIHVQNALRAKGKILTEENGKLEVLQPGTRSGSKESRIDSALSWPLQNNKIHYLDTIKPSQMDRLKLEMEKFPYWKDDGIDMLHYIYKMIKDYRFPEYTIEEVKLDKWDRRENKFQSRLDNWLYN